MDLTTIIITRNRFDLLKKAIRSVKNISRVVVVDNGSTDKTIHYLAKTECVYIRNTNNTGVTKARNQGFEKVRTKYFMFLDDDAYIKNPHELKKALTYLDQNKDVSILVPKLVYENGTIQESVRNFPNILGVIWRGSGLYAFFPNFKPYKRYVLKTNSQKPISVDWGIGACQIIRSADFKRVGKLDEKFFFGWEDIDFCKRINTMGKRVMYYPKLVSIHVYTRTSAKGINIMTFQHTKSIVYYYIKHLLT